jgi:nitroimidazol reductase NimA-like FMN-containing flavoprotein (pyridoxamine 5'-phosphate oxidase superfamily)
MREQALIVDGNRNRLQREIRQQIEDAGEAGILDGDAIARSQVLTEDPLDSIERTADDGDVGGRHAIASELPARQSHQVLVVEGFAVHTLGNAGATERGGQLRQKSAIGIPLREVPHIGRQFDRKGGGGLDGRANAGSSAASGDHHSALPEDAVGGGHGGRTDLQKGSEPAHRRQRLASGYAAGGYSLFHAGGDVDRRASLDVTLYYHMSDIVLEHSGSVQSPRTTVRRLPTRGAYDRATIEAILDEALICHVGFIVEGQPMVIPTIHARVDDALYVHGSVASRMLRSLEQGVPACVTVTLLDGLVLARSAFHHSMNYRSVVVLGTATAVVDREEKRRVLDALVEHVMKGRSADARPPSEAELNATMVLRLPITEASAKIRTGPPLDDEEDYALPVWAGVLPLELKPLEPVADPRLRAGIELPPYLRERE